MTTPFVNYAKKSFQYISRFSILFEGQIVKCSSQGPTVDMIKSDITSRAKLKLK